MITISTLFRIFTYSVFHSCSLLFLFENAQLSTPFIVYLRFPFFFFFNDTATTEIYTLSLHDALPICRSARNSIGTPRIGRNCFGSPGPARTPAPAATTTTPASGRESPGELTDAVHAHRSEEHTSELQSLAYLVCRLLLEKKKKEIKQSIVTRVKQSKLTVARGR